LPNIETILADYQTDNLLRLRVLKGHAQLITGSAGLGQFELALQLASSWLCEQPRANGLACGHCASCHLIEAKSHPDLAMLMPETLMLARMWPLPEKAQDEIDSKKRQPSKIIRVDDVREAITFAQRTNSRGVGKVAVIYPAHAMNREAANALLRTLEEPVGETRFILVSDDSTVLLPTIRSRCQTFVVTAPKQALALDWLTTQEMSLADAKIWLKFAGGQPKTAFDLAEKFMSTKVLQNMPAILKSGATAAQLPTGLVEAPQLLLDFLQKLCHDLLCKAQGALPRFFETEWLANLNPAVKRLSDWSKALNSHVRSVEHPLNPSLRLEAILSQTALVLNS
jgi:DNA polymerase III subunit delta'